nr:immunoglobulin heavy chain junction region [Macaca mulatta]MOW46715.1 immunoglobulin heavy chain junction region [Macaca mulatta]
CARDSFGSGSDFW